MRIAPLILLLVLCGCDQGSRGPGPTKTITNGKDRLTMRYVAREPMRGGGTGYDFNSLVWERKEGDTWRERAVITQQQFEAGADRRRWVSELHSFNPTTGNAIIKVAAGDAPRDSIRVRIVYSWREWNLCTNEEVGFIRICKDPFEKY